MLLSELGEGRVFIMQDERSLAGWAPLAYLIIRKYSIFVTYVL